MSYRNDHDAALARVDALQAEVAQLKRDAATSPKPPVQRRRMNRWLGVALGAITLTTIFTGAFVIGANAEAESRTSEAVAQLDTRVHRTSLDMCVEAIRPVPTSIVPDTVSPGDMRAIEGTAAPCRTVLHDIQNGGLWSPTESEALESWIAAEDKLGNAITMMSVYYAERPLIDGGASASQLWREYERAHAERDAAILRWRRTL